MGMDIIFMKGIKISNKMFFSFLLIIIFIFIGLSFKKYFVDMNYLIHAEIACNNLEENCFVGYCDPEYEECSDIEEENIFYYKKVQRLANKVLLCDPQNEECNAMVCGVGEPECEQIFCNLSNRESECSSSGEDI